MRFILKVTPEAVNFPFGGVDWFTRFLEMFDMVKNISIKEAFSLPGSVLIDVRSEEEFDEATIPGSINIPLLNNEERARVGTVYKNQSPVRARRLGLELVSPKLPEMLKTFEKAAGENGNVILFCWRGGMRSQFVSYMLDMMGFNVYRVLGGYKAYRKYVNLYLNPELPHRAVVLHGLTGVGKTEVLLKLGEKNIPVLDLEGLAQHKGSVFGKIGMKPSPSQKMFEGLIVESLKTAGQKGIFVVECESRRLGRLLVPQSVLDAMESGYRILLYATMGERVKRSVKDYVLQQKNNIDQLREAVTALTKYLGRSRVEALNTMLLENRFSEAVEILLKDYYDPLYKYPSAPGPDYHLSVDTADIEYCVDKIAQFISGLPEYGIPVNGGVWDGDREYAEECQGSQRNFSVYGGGRDKNPPEVPGSIGK